MVPYSGVLRRSWEPNPQLSGCRANIQNTRPLTVPARGTKTFAHNCVQLSEEKGHSASGGLLFCVPVAESFIISEEITVKWAECGLIDQMKVYRGQEQESYCY